ncbi:penicillin-binding protein 2 [Nocardioides sp. YIM 152315]|uniref:peptidoglycan D,D-transpeptidase FtsI family protein n=1 Tax=Nocardioides sp. YIM 152315 TaxID=3031760 RepID=UPI0023D990F0|nr:penicillin-binding protein 2 [Nocardioides sp. YIM 152315]MDF1603067.1 penicillin-binding protein 2 [Nocardioides sp. YIM 152315]
MPATTPRGTRRGSPQLRLRIGFVVIAMALSVFGARLVQLQGIDPNSYAEMAAAEGIEEVELPATRGEIVDRDGEPLASSVDGMMLVADPKLTDEHAADLAAFLYKLLDVDYVSTLAKLRAHETDEGVEARFEYVARRVPATIATDVVEEAERRGFEGLDTWRDPLRDYPAGDVAANLVGFVGTDEPLAGLERTFDKELAGIDGSARYEVGSGNRLPLGESTTTDPVDGRDLETTLDLKLQWYAQRVVRQTVEDARADSGFAVVMDTRTGELLAVADDPTYDANKPTDAPKADLGSRALQNVYEPGSVQKVLTASSLIDLGLVTPRTKIVVPSQLDRDGRVIHDWFGHGTLHMTLTGAIAQSSNIATVLAADKFKRGQLYSYLRHFGLGRRTDIGVRGETKGLLPPLAEWTSQLEDRIDFGQSLSVNGVQMTAAINTIANGGVRVSPSLVKGSATTDDGQQVGTDHTTRKRVVGEQAARQTAIMMERVVDPDVGVAPAAAVPGYRVAGKTGTAQAVGAECGCYDGTFTVSFAGFAPADDPRFTIYVVVQNPRNGGGGGSVAGPAFSQIMSYALRRYQVPPTGTRPSRLPVAW